MRCASRSKGNFLRAPAIIKAQNSTPNAILIVALLIGDVTELHFKANGVVDQMIMTVKKDNGMLSLLMLILE